MSNVTTKKGGALLLVGFAAVCLVMSAFFTGCQDSLSGAGGISNASNADAEVGIAVDADDIDLAFASYTVEFHRNYGVQDITDSQRLPCGEGGQLKKISNMAGTGWSREDYGYKFGGWAGSADGEKIYDDENLVFALAERNATVKLYAKWDLFKVGDTGPGGGIIFYYNAVAFSAGTQGYYIKHGCHFLELAPNFEKDKYKHTFEDGSGYADGGARTDPPNVDINATRDARYGGKDDWYLPSLEDIRKLYNAKDAVPGLYPQEGFAPGYLYYGNDRQWGSVKYFRDYPYLDKKAGQEVDGGYAGQLRAVRGF